MDLSRFCMLMLDNECQIQDRVGNYASVHNSQKSIQYKYEFFSPAFAEMLLRKKRNHVKKVVKKELYPVRSYARLYLKGDNLIKHKDKKILEWSVSIHLGGDKWNIYFDDKPYLLMPGDAIIYNGNIPHYRKEFKSNGCYQVFLHYSTDKKNMFEGREYYKMYGKQSDV